LPGMYSGQAVFLGHSLSTQVAQDNKDSNHNGHGDADHVHAANLNGGEEASADPGVAVRQRALGLGLQDDVAKAAAHQHGSQGDNEGGDLQLGHEEAHESTEQRAYCQGGQHSHRGADAKVHDQSTGHSAAGSDDRANAQVHVTSQYAQQHTDSQDDNVAVLHDDVVNGRRGQVLTPGHDGEDQIHGDEGQYHAVLLQAQINFLLSRVLHSGVFHYSSPFRLLWAIILPVIASWVISLPTSLPAISPSFRF